MINNVDDFAREETIKLFRNPERPHEPAIICESLIYKYIADSADWNSCHYFSAGEIHDKIFTNLILMKKHYDKYCEADRLNSKILKFRGNDLVVFDVIDGVEHCIDCFGNFWEVNRERGNRVYMISAEARLQ